MRKAVDREQIIGTVIDLIGDNEALHKHCNAVAIAAGGNANEEAEDTAAYDLYYAVLTCELQAILGAVSSRLYISYEEE